MRLQVGLGNFVTQGIRKAFFASMNDEDRQQALSVITQLPAFGRFYNDAVAYLNAARDANGDTPGVQLLSTYVDQLAQALTDVDAMVRQAVKDARDDGNTIPRLDGEDSATLGALPLLIVVPLAVAAIVAAYALITTYGTVIQAAMHNITALVAARDQVRQLIAANRPDLAAQVRVPTFGSGSNSGGSSLSGLWSLPVLAAIVIGGFFALSRRKGRA